MTPFPRTEVARISMPRMLMGTNWVLGYSHRSSSADAMIRDCYAERDKIVELIDAYLAYDIDAIMAPFGGNPTLIDAVKAAEDKHGRPIIRIDTPNINVEDSAAGRAEARRVIENSRKIGSTFCLIHHSSAEKLVNKGKGTIERLPDYLSMIRDNGLIPGLSAHMPELILYSDANEYDVETYLQIYNCMGFLMQVEIEAVHKIIWNAKKPVMTIKSMAAGRCTPFVGLTFNYATLRPCDMVTVGAFTPREVHEDVEIALAAIERRPPMMEGRSSPNKTAVLGGNIKG